MVIDLSRISTFNEKDGAYNTKYIRFDIINGKYGSDSCVDVEYFAIHDNLEEIYALNADMGSVWYVDAAGNGTDVTVGEQ